MDRPRVLSAVLARAGVPRQEQELGWRHDDAFRTRWRRRGGGGVSTLEFRNVSKIGQRKKKDLNRRRRRLGRQRPERYMSQVLTWHQHLPADN